MAAPTRQDLYMHGLPAAALVAPARQILSVDVSANTFLLPGHGFPDGRPLRFSSLGGSLPTGLSPSSIYYALTANLGGDLFKASATNVGVAVDVSSEGSGVLYVTEQIEDVLDQLLEDKTDEVLADCIAHKGAPDPLPRHFVALVCRYAARARVVVHGLGNAFYQDAVKALFEGQRIDDAIRARWRSGQPVPGFVDDTPEVAENAAVVSADDETPEVFA